MIGRFVPKEGRFFDLFSKSADLGVEASKEFRKMLDHLSEAETFSRTIKDIEHQADQVTLETIELLHQTFITPLDREDIYKLIAEMDSIVDSIESASERIFLYGMKTITPEAIGLADVCILSVEHVRKAVQSLQNLKNPDEIVRHCVEVNRLENEADHFLRAGMAKLFREEPDTRQLIKMKEIYEILETVTDRCEDVANIIEGIVLEYA